MSDDEQDLTRAELRRRRHEPRTRADRGRQRHQRRTTLRRRALIGAGLVVALVATVALATVLHLNDNISRVDIAAGSGDRP